MRLSGTSDARRALRRRAAGRVAMVVVLATALSGCGLRLETPPPSALVPDATETARQRSTGAAVSLEVLAGRAVGADAATDQVLADVIAVSQAHLDALGGIYEPGGASLGPPAAGPQPSGSVDPGTGSAGPTVVPDADPSPDATPDATEGAVDPGDVVSLLAESGADAREDAEMVPDGAFARLLASIAISRWVLAEVLAAAAALPPPTAGDAEEGDADSQVTLPRTFTVPDTVPAGLTSNQLTTLVQSEDGLGLAWEIVAARSSGERRQRAADRARQHRERAERWAQTAEIAGTGQDPRRSSYDVGPVLTEVTSDPAAVDAELARLEGGLAVAYTSWVASVAAESRPVLIDAALDAARTQVALGGALGPFPGMPDQDVPDQPE